MTDKQLSAFVEKVSRTQGGGQTDDFHERRLLDSLYKTIPKHSPIGTVEPGNVQVGRKDVPLLGEQPDFLIDLGRGAAWLTGGARSGRTHGLRAILDDWSRRHETGLIVSCEDRPRELLSGSAGRSVALNWSDIIECSNVIRQLWHRHFLESAAIPLLFIVDRIDLLLRALGDDQRGFDYLKELVVDGASRGIHVAVTAEAVPGGFARNIGTEVALTVGKVDPVPHAAVESKTATSMFYSGPRDVHPGSDLPPHYPPLGVPDRPALNDLLRASQRIVYEEKRVPIGVDWLTFEPAYLGGRSVAVVGDSGDHIVMRTLGGLFASTQVTIHIARSSEPDLIHVSDAGKARTERVDLAGWNKDVVISTIRSVQDGVIVVPAIDTKSGELNGPSLEIHRELLANNWTVLASASSGATSLYDNAQSHSRFLAHYGQCLWLRVRDRTGITNYSDPDRFPSWPRPLDQTNGDAYLLSSDATAMTIRMPDFADV